MEKGMFGEKIRFRPMLVLDIWAALGALQAAVARDGGSVCSTSEFPLTQPGPYVASKESGRFSCTCTI